MYEVIKCHYQKHTHSYSKNSKLVILIKKISMPLYLYSDLNAFYWHGYLAIWP